MPSGVFKLIYFSGKDEKWKHIQGFRVWKLGSVVKLLLQRQVIFRQKMLFLPKEFCKHINDFQNVLDVQDDGSANRLSSYRRNLPYVY